MAVIKFDTVEDSLKYVEGMDGDDVYEFGVFSGNTLGRIIDGLRRKNVKVGHFWGFDSFEGLPAEDPKVWHNPEWPEGAFNVQADFGLKSIDEAIEFVHKNIEQVNVDKNVILIPGYFSETCTRDWIDNPDWRPAQYIHIDADIFISSFQALDFCFNYGIAQYGTIVRFDDIASTFKVAGQHLAWDKVKYSYCIEYEQLSYNVFRILRYNDPFTP
jgi:hypothetical protein